MWHNQGSEVPQQLPRKVLEVVTYNVNLEIWTTAQREAGKVSLHIFLVYNLNEKGDLVRRSFVRIDIKQSPKQHSVTFSWSNWVLDYEFDFVFTTGISEKVPTELPADYKILEK